MWFCGLIVDMIVLYYVLYTVRYAWCLYLEGLLEVVYILSDYTIRLINVFWEKSFNILDRLTQILDTQIHGLRRTLYVFVYLCIE